MTSRFSVTPSPEGLEIVFDDGGMNLLSRAALLELRTLIATVECGPVLRFRSGRSRLFAAGADMAEMQHFTASDAHAFAELGQEVFAAIERLPCLTVALIDGDCFGGALDLVLAFDVRLASPSSRFAHPGARIGIVTGFGGTSRWRQVLRRPAATQLFLANRILSAEEARNVGLVDRVGESHAAELARYVSLDPEGIGTIKALTSRSGVTRGELLQVAVRDR